VVGICGRGGFVLNIAVIGMGYVGIPCAALLADVPGFRVTGVQRQSERSGWKIECLNGGNCPFEGDEPGLAELIHRVVVEKGTFRVTDDYAVCKDAGVILRFFGNSRGVGHIWGYSGK